MNRDPDAVGSDVDALLREAGAEFRANHDRPVQVSSTGRSRRRLPGLVPVLAAASAVAVIAGGAAAVTTLRHDRAPVPAVEDTAAPTPTAESSSVAVPLAMDGVNAVALADNWVAVAGGGVGQAAKQRLEVRRRSDPGRVVATVQSRYRAGGPACVAVAGDVVLWTDSESIPSDYAPGPSTRWALWERNLQTGSEHRLAAGDTDDSTGPQEVPCPVAGSGFAAWSVGGRLTVRDVAHETSSTTPDNGRPMAITAAGIVETDYGKSVLHIVLRPGPDFSQRRVLTSVTGGTDAAAGGNHVLVFARDPAGDSADGAIVSGCTLSTCADLTELRRDPSSGRAVVSDDFAAWSHLADSPAVLRFDGGPAPALATGYVPFQSLAASGDTLGYVTQPEGEPGVLHLQRIGMSTAPAQPRGVPAALARLPYDRRVHAVATARTAQGDWIASRPPSDIDDANGSLHDYGEILLVRDQRILRAYPMYGVPPQALAVVNGTVYCSRQGDGGLGDSMLCRIDDQGELTVRIFPSPVDTGFPAGTALPAGWVLDRPVSDVLFTPLGGRDGSVYVTRHNSPVRVDPFTLELAAP